MPGYFGTGSAQLLGHEVTDLFHRAEFAVAGGIGYRVLSEVALNAINRYEIIVLCETSRGGGEGRERGERGGISASFATKLP